MILLEPWFEGPYNVSCYDVTMPNGRKFTVHGKQASLLSLLLSGYVVQDDFHPFDAFSPESLAANQAAAKVVSDDAESV